jgi:pimeloyl-ACP methyl ester carboxylesterase
LLTNAVYVRDPAGEDAPHLRFRRTLPILAEAIAPLGDFPSKYSDDDALAAPSVRWAGPTLFLRGGKSDYITRRNLTVAQHFFPDWKVITIPHAGHWVHADAPEETTKSISSFVRDILG